jgi:hypothetical protein
MVLPPPLAGGVSERGQSVGRYVAARLIQLLFVLTGVSVVVFIAMHLLPGDVAQLLLGDHATNEQLQRLREQLGLDQPVWVQYARFMRDALSGDLGISIQSNRPALQDVVAAFPVTLQLALASLMLASLCGVPIGVLSGVWQGSRFDAVPGEGVCHAPRTLSRVAPRPLPQAGEVYDDSRLVAANGCAVKLCVHSV